MNWRIQPSAGVRWTRIPEGAALRVGVLRAIRKGNPEEFIPFVGGSKCWKDIIVGGFGAIEVDDRK